MNNLRIKLTCAFAMIFAAAAISLVSHRFGDEEGYWRGYYAGLAHGKNDAAKLWKEGENGYGYYVRAMRGMRPVITVAYEPDPFFKGDAP